MSASNGLMRGRRVAAPQFPLVCALVAALAASGGCITPVLPGGPRLGLDTLSLRRPPRDHGRVPQTVLAVTEKRVGGKEEPATLIAEDGSRCNATKRRYRETEVGDWALCAWRRDDRSP